MSAPMSTPISNIPLSSASQPPIEEDPEVNAILQEMQQSAPQPSIVQQHAVAPMRYAAPPQYMQAPTAVSVSPSKPYFHSETAQRAVYAALIAYVLFYPKTLEMIYTKFSFMEKFQSYDMVIRFLLLALVLYALMWKLQI